MIISERIFMIMEEKGLSQIEFARMTGISQSTISDWKRKKTNPVSEKILIICDVLDVTPYELLGATEGKGRRSNPSDVIVLNKSSEAGQFMDSYLSLGEKQQLRLLGYMRALTDMASKDE